MARTPGCLYWRAARSRWGLSTSSIPLWQPAGREITKAEPEPAPDLGGVFPFTVGLFVRDKSDIKQIADLKGKRMAWDYGGHAINQTWQNAMMETAGLKATDVVQVRVSNLNDGVRAVPEGKSTRLPASASARRRGSQRDGAGSLLESAKHRGDKQDPQSLRRIGGEVRACHRMKGETYVIGYPLQLVSSTKERDRTVATLLKPGGTFG